jgi:lysophospholipase L1-like esterase
MELEMLVASVQRTGATPILMAHAFRAARPLRAEDYRDLESFRVFMPRAVPEVIADFEAAANDEIRRIAAARGLLLVDLPREIQGCRECFGDLVHFTDRGAAIMADAIATQIKPILR